MRDHSKLRAFELADQIAILIYRITRSFPKEENVWIDFSDAKGSRLHPIEYRGGMCTPQSDGISSIHADRIWLVEGTSLPIRACTTARFHYRAGSIRMRHNDAGNGEGARRTNTIITQIEI